MIENTLVAFRAELLACVTQEFTCEEERLVPSRSAGTVLMIDESQVLGSSVAIALRTQGFRVVQAHDGRSGVDLFQAHEAVIGVESRIVRNLARLIRRCQ